MVGCAGWACNPRPSYCRYLSIHLEAHWRGIPVSAPACAIGRICYRHQISPVHRKKRGVTASSRTPLKHIGRVERFWGASSAKNGSTPVSTAASRNGALPSKFGKFAKIITDRIQHAEEETAVYFCYRSCLVSESQVKSEDCALRIASRVRRRLRAAV